MAEIDDRAAAAAVQEQEQPARAAAVQEQEQPARAAAVQEQEQPARASVKLPGERAGTFVYGDGHGFYYHSEGVRCNKRFLKCVEKKKLSCLARASMGLEEGAPIMATYASPFHNHFPDEAKAETMVFMATLKEKAKNEEGLRITQIFDQEADRNPRAAIAVSPMNAKKAMKRARGLAEPAIPRTLEQMREEMMLPGREGLKTTKGGEENFLIDLAIKGAAGETLADGFASRRTVEFLRRHPGEASHVMMDATFKIIPRRPLGVHQLFSVHAIYMDIAFLVAIFFMTRKSEESYTRVLTFVREQLITWPVVRITTDFEVALINASKRIFPGAQHQGCWFHFTQSIWRYVMSHDLSAVCRADADTMKVVKMVMALPHLPAQRGPPHSDRVPPFSIGDGLNAIIDYINEGEMDARLQNLTAYVRRFWLGVIGVDSLSTFGCARRTNNDLESFHAKLLSAFGVNLDIWSFIRRLQSIEKSSYDNIIRAHGDIAVNRPREDKITGDINKAIRRLIDGRITIIHFLSAVAHGVDNIVNRPLPQNEWFLIDIAGEEEVV